MPARGATQSPAVLSGRAPRCPYRKVYTQTRRLTKRDYEALRGCWGKRRKAWRTWRRAHATQIRERRLWRYYRDHPMPWCTWGPESGASLSEYHPARYRARNSSSTAGGKYQIINGTWYANGGGRYADSHPAAAAPPLEQERIARNVLASQGLGAWVRC